MKNRKILILLTRFPDKGSKVIAAITGCHYPHASIGLDEDPNTFYSFVTKGFIIESVVRYIRPNIAPYPCQLYELAVSEKVYCSVQKLLQSFIRCKDRLRYTKLGLILSLLHIPHKQEGFGYFCTQFVAHVLQSSGAAKLKKSSTRYFAGDLIKLPGMKLCYQGNLQTMLAHYAILPCVA